MKSVASSGRVVGSSRRFRKTTSMHPSCKPRVCETGRRYKKLIWVVNIKFVDCFLCAQEGDNWEREVRMNDFHAEADMNGLVDERNGNG